MSVNILSDRYEVEKEFLQAVLSKWKSKLETLARPIDPNVFIDGRVKQLQSLLTKAYKRGAEEPRRWEDFGDLVALKVVFPTLEGSQLFTQALQDYSETQGIDCYLDARRSKPDSLQYSSDQFDLCDNSICDSRGVGQKIEVQVRTVASDAWYMIDHRLRYKNAIALPDEMKRRVLRLIVLTELFDAEVDSLVKDVKALELDTPAGAFNKIRELFNEFAGIYAPPTRPEGLFETLWEGYQEDSQDTALSNLQTFLRENEDHLRHIFQEHKHGAENYVEKYDWLYAEPEVLLVAHLAQKPRYLADVIRDSDFEELIESMADEFKIRKKFTS